MHAIIPIITIIACALIAWVATDRFSPDPLLTYIVKIVIFVVVLLVIILKLLPMAGLSF